MQKVDNPRAGVERKKEVKWYTLHLLGVFSFPFCTLKSIDSFEKFFKWKTWLLSCHDENGFHIKLSPEIGVFFWVHIQSFCPFSWFIEIINEYTYFKQTFHKIT